MVDEELLVALDGKNLKQGGSVAWVAYWGCAVTSNVDACETQFASTFEAGNVAVTFKSIDYFIPCYRDPPNPLKAQEYKCFEHVRIRVKDKRSIPGWSRLATRSSIISKSAEAVTLRSIEQRDSFKMVTCKSEKGLLSPTISQDVAEATSSKRGIVTLMESTVSIEIPVPPEYGVTDNDEPSGLDKEGVWLSSEGDTSGNEIDCDVSEAADKELIEVEVTPAAELKMISLHVESDTVHRREKAASPLRSLQIVSYIQEVTLEKSQNQEEAISAGSADELEPMLSVTEVVLDVYTDEGAERMEEEPADDAITTFMDKGAERMEERPADDAITTTSDGGKILQQPDRTIDE
uniref:Uncharacterized protein n=1 Tax=Hyaloperonospora arabidopsidis (strain Emoy2) TaxID=559515 RepID=M4BH27_HYAAE